MSLRHLTNLDANEQIFFERELEHVKSKTYDILREELQARTLIPVSYDAGAGAETITYHQHDQTGIAKIISNYADDLPVANIKGLPFSSPVRSLGIAFIYSLQDIRASMMANKNLPQRESNAAARGMAETEESIAAVGDTESGLGGFLNNANVTLGSADDPGAGKAWIADSKTADQIIYDMATAVQTILNVTNGVEKPDTQLLPHLEYGHIAQKRVSDLAETVLSFFLRTNPWISNIAPWSKLATADAGGTGPRMVTYKRHPDKVTLEIPQDYEMLPTQQENLSFKTPCHQRIGGVIVYYPLSVHYMDDI